MSTVCECTQCVSACSVHGKQKLGSNGSNMEDDGMTEFGVGHWSLVQNTKRIQRIDRRQEIRSNPAYTE
jgi:hypothetical protein